jgi:hypothetical protein
VIDGRSIGGRKTTAVAGGTLIGYRHLAVVPACGFPRRCAVAADAVHRRRDMGSRLAGRPTAVVATGAVGGGSKQTVVRLGRRPGAGGFVAAFARRLAAVDGGSRATGHAKAGAHVAGGTLARHGDIAVKLSWIPARIPALVTRIAIGYGDSAQGFVGNMVSRGPVCRWKAAAMAGGALVGNRHLAVVPGRRFPAVGAMAADAVNRRGNMGCSFARGRTAVVAACAVGCSSHSTVIHARRRQPTRSLVTGTASCLCRYVSGGFASRGGAIVATCTRTGCYTQVVKLRACKRNGGVAAFATQLGLKVTCRFDYIGLGQASPVHVTTGAIPGSAFENTCNMAGLATGVRMKTGE